jgi:hypothetical protein
MLKKLLQINTPTVVLWIYFFALAALLVFSEEDANRTADVIAQLTFPLILSLWVLVDARKRGQQLCYDYGSFVFLAWPIIVPAYLFQTRGFRAFITLICFAGICVLAILFGFTLATVREFAS